MLDTRTILPRATLYRGRFGVVLRACAGKRVLHLGCVDTGLLEERHAGGRLLHTLMAEAAAELWGLDSNRAGLDWLRAKGVENLICASAMELESVAELRGEHFDLLVATELMEHLSDPGRFLSSVQTLMRPGATELLLSVPNAFRLRTLFGLLRGVEDVHPDHYCHYSYATLRHMLTSLGFEIVELAAYTHFPARRATTLAEEPPPEAGGERRGPGAWLRGLAGNILFGRTVFFGDGLIARVKLPAS